MGYFAVAARRGGAYHALKCRWASPMVNTTPADIAELTRRLGERVRRHRARRGMSRKVLSQLSGVSERYLAQLESGRANVSLNILWSLAQAIDTSVTALLGENEENGGAAHQPAEAGSPAGGLVALIGLRGAGKTTLGRRLAQHFQVPMVRLSTMIEQMAGVDLPEIFLSLGQKGYRRLEASALAAAIGQNSRAVIETGGSLVSEPETLDRLLAGCFTVWIKASPEEHMLRVMAQGDMRPIEGHRQRAMEDLRAILESRGGSYGRANAVIDTSRRGIDECLAELIGICGPTLSI
jgi:XRE family transcriptional regulator, aerobic/anaerobic benzoate catabolism transcriptional regulator